MTSGTYLLMGSGLGVLVGLLLGWMLGRRAASPDVRLEQELRQLLAQRETELERLRSELTRATSAQAAAEAARNGAEKLLGQQKEFQEQALRDNVRAQEKALSDLRTAFKALSVDALREVQPQFVERVTESV